MSKKKIYIIVGVLAFLLVSYVVIVLIIFSKNNTPTSDISQQTAPPYDGQPIVSFQDQTNGQLYRSIGSEKYVELKYFIGEYLNSRGIAKNPVPRVTVTNFKNDLEFLGQSGQYNNIYVFDVNSSSINSSFTVKVVESPDNLQTIATVEPNLFSKNISSYSYEKY